MTSREWIEKEYGTSHLYDVMLMEDLSTILDIMQEYGDDRADSQKSSVLPSIISTEQSGVVVCNHSEEEMVEIPEGGLFCTGCQEYVCRITDSVIMGGIINQLL